MPWVEGSSELDVRLLNDRERFPWLTLKPLAWFDPETGLTFTVPKYFRTDGASIPIALAALPVIGQSLVIRFFGEGIWQGFKEGVLHDRLRRKRAILDNLGEVVGYEPPIVPAEVAHRIFREALAAGRYPDDLIESYYQAVRTFNSED